MAVLTTLDDNVQFRSDLSTMDFGSMEELGQVTSLTATELVVDMGGVAVTFRGSFNAADGLGWPTGGVIDSFEVSMGGPVTGRFEGLGVDVALWRYLAEAHDARGFADAILGGADTIRAGAQDDFIFGYGGDDVVRGMAGADFIDGGLGADTLFGGKGKDKFQVSNAGESSAAAPDLIADLRDNDKLKLKAVDADRTTAGDQAFVIVSAFDGHAGQLVVSYDAGAGVTSFMGDTDGDGVANLVIQATGDHSAYDHFQL